MTTLLDFPDFEDMQSGWDAFIDTAFQMVRRVLGGQDADGEIDQSEPRPITLYADAASLPAIALGNNDQTAQALSAAGGAGVRRLFWGNTSTSTDEKIANYYRIPIGLDDVVATLIEDDHVSGYPNVPAIPNATATSTVFALLGDINANALVKIRGGLGTLALQMNSLINLCVESSVLASP